AKQTLLRSSRRECSASLWLAQKGIASETHALLWGRLDNFDNETLLLFCCWNCRFGLLRYRLCTWALSCSSNRRNRCAQLRLAIGWKIDKYAESTLIRQTFYRRASQSRRDFDYFVRNRYQFSSCCRHHYFTYPQGRGRERRGGMLQRLRDLLSHL